MGSLNLFKTVGAIQNFHYEGVNPLMIFFRKHVSVAKCPQVGSLSLRHRAHGRWLNNVNVSLHHNIAGKSELEMQLNEVLAYNQSYLERWESMMGDRVIQIIIA